MKTKYWVITAFALFIVAVSYATETPKMDVKLTEAEKALVVFKSVSAFPLEITISNGNGEILYCAQTEKPETEYQKFFDLTAFNYGSYNICMKYGSRSINRNLIISKSKIKISPPLHLYEPYFYFKNQQLYVSHFNVAQKNVYLNIYEKGKYVSGVNLGKDLAIQKSLDFSKLKKGEYEIVLTDNFKDHNYLVHR